MLRCICNCVHMCMHLYDICMWMCGWVCLCAHMGKPERDTGCLLLSLATLSSVSHWTASFPVQWGWPASRLWDPSVSTSRCWERIQPCSAFNMSVSDSNTGPHGQSKQSQPLSYCPCSQLYILNRELSHKGNKKILSHERGQRPSAGHGKGNQTTCQALCFIHLERCHRIWTKNQLKYKNKEET